METIKKETSTTEASASGAMIGSTAKQPTTKMAFNPSPKVAAARDVAKRFGMNKVVILMLNERDGTMEYASYGDTARECSEAKRLADAVYDAAYQHIIAGQYQPGPRPEIL